MNEKKYLLLVEPSHLINVGSKLNFITRLTLKCQSENRCERCQVHTILPQSIKSSLLK